MRFGTVFLSAGVLAVAGLHASPAAMAAGTMRAAVITGPETVKVESVPIPEAGPGQVRIKVYAASVNPVDWKVASRVQPGSQQPAGRDLAGVIDAVGDANSPWKKGDAVVALVPNGAYAEYAVASVNAVAAKPTKMSFEEASGIPIVAETAWRSIVTIGEVRKGQRVLIHGAAGGVGSSAVQFAKARGAYVIGTASARNHEFLKSLGVDETIDYNTTRFEEKVKDVDLVLNTADADTNARSIGVVKKGGKLVSIVGPPDAAACSARGIWCGGVGSMTGQQLQAIVEFANANPYRIHVERTMALEDVGRAWELSKAGHTRGKIVLVVSSGGT